MITVACKTHIYEWTCLQVVFMSCSKLHWLWQSCTAFALGAAHLINWGCVELISHSWWSERFYCGREDCVTNKCWWVKWSVFHECSIYRHRSLIQLSSERFWELLVHMQYQCSTVSVSVWYSIGISVVQYRYQCSTVSAVQSSSSLD